MSADIIERDKMPSNLVTLTLEGKEEEKGYLRVLDLADEIHHFASALESMDCAMSAERTHSLYLRVIGLRQESPAVIEMEVCTLVPEVDRRAETIDAFIAAMASLQAGGSGKPLNREFVKRLRDFAKPIGDSIKTVKISANGSALGITPDLYVAIDQMVSEERPKEEVYRGFIRGVLEYLNIHGTTRTLKVYPDIGPSTVTCHFPDALIDDAVRGIKRYVEIRGMIHLSDTDEFPHAVDVEEIEVFPKEDDLPGFDDLLGIAPDLTGEKLSEEFVRDVRDADEAK
jgi:hypothetical protein